MIDKKKIIAGICLTSLVFSSVVYAEDVYTSPVFMSTGIISADNEDGTKSEFYASDFDGIKLSLDNLNNAIVKTDKEVVDAKDKAEGLAGDLVTGLNSIKNKLDDPGVIGTLNDLPEDATVTQISDFVNTIDTDLSGNFGNVTASSVVSGKTFTANGTGQAAKGTHVCDTPSGTKTITSNGIYDVSDYASVDVDVETSSSTMIENVVLNLKYKAMYDCQMGTGTFDIPVTKGHYYLLVSGGGTLDQVPIKSGATTISSKEKIISNFCTNYTGSVTGGVRVVKATANAIKMEKNQYVSTALIIYEFNEF